MCLSWQIASDQIFFGPKHRLPDASIDTSELIKDIQSIKDVGEGGIEFLSFYNYGFRHPSFPPWDEFGFGSPKFKRVFLAALRKAVEEGLVFDFSIGPNQGQGIQAGPMTPGLAVQLVHGETLVSAGRRFQGPIPEPNINYNFDLSELAPFMHKHEGWGDSKLVAVVVGGVKSGKSQKRYITAAHPAQLTPFMLLTHISCDDRKRQLHVCYHR